MGKGCDKNGQFFEAPTDRISQNPFADLTCDIIFLKNGKIVSRMMILC